ncbi:hypothetical protein PENFLA_c044G01223 [Penicillium flavigenum]|uniref:Uncharacterized protein n=1 Tax=Penicillium flavigenum TaxID=254877 RepID=A0A1V6SJG7_9EURO|nr:hypothetical protein PENFLA_c044G01223 [Penicillium flavigenum]
MKQKLTETMANTHNIPTVGEWELDLLTRLRVQREKREHARTQILLKADLLINVAQGVIATAHPQHVVAHNLLWALQERMEILRMEWVGLERSIWARCR